MLARADLPARSFVATPSPTPGPGHVLWELMPLAAGGADERQGAASAPHRLRLPPQPLQRHWSSLSLLQHSQTTAMAPQLSGRQPLSVASLHERMASIEVRDLVLGALNELNLHS